MGLITGLLTLPLAPVRGVGWVAEQVRRQAEQELARSQDPAHRLADIESAWEAGEITDQRRDDLEEEVLRDLLGSGE